MLEFDASRCCRASRPSGRSGDRRSAEGTRPEPCSSPAPVDLEDISKLGNVTYELLKRGYDEATIRKVLGENTLRVMREVEAVAAR